MNHACYSHILMNHACFRRLIRHNAAAAETLGKRNSKLVSEVMGGVHGMQSVNKPQRSQRMGHHARTFIESAKNYPTIVVDGPFGAPCELYLQVMQCVVYVPHDY
jgi:hypothetical protein